MHNAKIGGNTEIYNNKQVDKLNEELAKFIEEKDTEAVAAPEEPAAKPEENAEAPKKWDLTSWIINKCQYSNNDCRELSILGSLKDHQMFYSSDQNHLKMLY